MKNVLVIGSGGREHVMAAKLAESALRVYCAPGNAGIAGVATCIDIKADDIKGLLAFALEKQIELVVVGPEVPLTLGIVDVFEKVDIPIFGPSKTAAIIEGSKIFTKELMLRYGIPTAPAQIFTSTESLRIAIKSAREVDNCFPVVIKVDGLAAGKGVGVCRSLDEALAFIERIDSGEFGEAADKILLEGFLVGEEASYIAMVDKNGHILPLASAQDHKPVYDNDQGPNTGGMGAYSPAPVVTDKVEERILEQIIKPTIAAMKKEGRPFVGFLYAGLMIDDKGNPFVVEFNCRLGDPEAQPILTRLDTDFLALLEHAVDGRLNEVELNWKPYPSVCVVLAAQGYPGTPKKGDQISGLKRAGLHAHVFHAGTATDDSGKLITNGGRVLGVTALGQNFSDAISAAYSSAQHVAFDGMHFRRDIGSRALLQR
jgi:phosphoribosylamine--glycine ligase